VRTLGKRVLLTAGMTLVALLAMGGVAAAANATISPAGEIGAVNLGKLSFTGGGITVRCNLTIQSTLARGPIELARGRTFGRTFEVKIAECEGGQVSAPLLNLPWTLTIESILGTIPSAITGLLFTLQRASFNLSVFGGFVNCLYEGPQGALLAMTAVAGTREPWRYQNGLITMLATRLPLIRGGFGCPSEGTMSGTIFPTGETISVR
jgi:hypothetical protein